MGHGYESSVELSEAVLEGFYKALKARLVNDVIIVSAGAAGLVAAWKLAEEGFKVTVLEEAGYLGGSMWLGEYFMSYTIVRSPAERILRELGVPFEEFRPGLYWVYGPLLAAKLITRALEAGAWVLNLASVDDVIVERGRVSGVLVRWSPVQGPIAMKAGVVIDASGREAKVAGRLAERGLLDLSAFRRRAAEGDTESLIMELTGEAYPGLIVAGLTVAELAGLSDAGLLVGATLLSGEKAARIASQMLRERGSSP